MNNLILPKLKSAEISSIHISNFERQFEYYLIANELDAKTEKVKIAHLRFALDTKLNDVLDSLNLNQDTLTTKELLQELKDNLLPKENAAYIQYTFFDRKQENHESFNDFYMDIKNLSAKCNFGDKTDDILKCKIVHGIKDPVLKERLYRSPELKLPEVINHCRASEDAKLKLGNGSEGWSEEHKDIHLIKRQQSSNTNTNSFSTAQNVQNYNHVHNREQNHSNTRSHQRQFNSNNFRGTSGKFNQQRHQFQRRNHRSSSPCVKCDSHHNRGRCPAYGKTCGLCMKMNHYTKCCFQNKNIQTINIPDNEDVEEGKMSTH
uniref:Uncharacterized protein n=1 Tax=Cacopsylla melanoneura TaxID=428564 RepID=A0A8D8ZS17_9HEMI